jgi:hypothetical protein
VLEKLADRSKKTVAAANEKNLSLSVYSDHADFVIPMFSLKEAMGYARPSGPFRDLLRRKPKLAGSQQAKVSNGELGHGTPAAKAGSPNAAFDLNVAAEHLAKVAERTPGLVIGKKTVARALTNRLPEFNTSGPSSYLGAAATIACSNASRRIAKNSRSTNTRTGASPSSIAAPARHLRPLPRLS